TIGIYHWNSVTNQRDLIGGGIWKSGAAATSWTPASVTIFYDSASSKADTAFVIFSAASLYSNPKVNDSLMIDSSSYVMATGIDNLSAHSDNVNLYPNPASNQVSLAATGQFQAGLVEVYDITGKLVSAYSMHNNFLTINTQQYTTGIYFYKMYDNTGVELNVGKFSVVK
ncbi:MAG TPA: T9SS type A sorting domain-containing protein, partial [Bacteroidia bacterium]|nr:T9SS type A sorting domain-containing protein [Bacteroidia bacterium]